MARSSIGWSSLLFLSTFLSVALCGGVDEKASLNQLKKDKSCCATLNYFLPGKVVNTSQPTYQSSQSSFWSAQEQDLRPACIVIPTSTQDVSTAVVVLSAGFQASIPDCKFAIRGGGHTPHAGAANIEGGVTIDLQSMNQVTVSGDKKFVSVGPGNRWENVYSVLDNLGLAMLGGRAATVGVAGLLTGGGISFFSARYGFACNNIQSYEVVLSDGSIVTASATQNAQLFRALKGGSNNFGIVTRFDAKLFQQSKFWGGQITQLPTERASYFSFVTKFATSATYDPYAALLSVFVWVQGAPAILVHTPTYTNGDVAWPPSAFQPLDNMTRVSSTMRKDSLSSFVSEVSGDPAPTQGFQNFFLTLSFVNDPKVAADFMAQAWDLSDAAVKDLASVSGFVFTLDYQPLPYVLYSKDVLSNVMGFERFQKDMFNLLFALNWQLVADNDKVYGRMKKLEADLVALEKKMGIFNEWVYLNYASQWQRPIESYGGGNVAFLKSVSRKYDPKGIFQKAVPGGYKLGT